MAPQENFHPLFSGVGGPAIDQIPQLPFWCPLDHPPRPSPLAPRPQASAPQPSALSPRLPISPPTYHRTLDSAPRPRLTFSNPTFPPPAPLCRWWASAGFGITFCEFYRISIAFRELNGETLKAETALRPGK